MRLILTHTTKGQGGVIRFRTGQAPEMPESIQWGWQTSSGAPWHMGRPDRTSAMIAALQELLGGEPVEVLPSDVQSSDQNEKTIALLQPLGEGGSLMARAVRLPPGADRLQAAEALLERLGYRLFWPVCPDSVETEIES